MKKYILICLTAFLIFGNLSGITAFAQDTDDQRTYVTGPYSGEPDGDFYIGNNALVSKGVQLEDGNKVYKIADESGSNTAAYKGTTVIRPHLNDKKALLPEKLENVIVEFDIYPVSGKVTFGIRYKIGSIHSGAVLRIGDDSVEHGYTTGSVIDKSLETGKWTHVIYEYPLNGVDDIATLYLGEEKYTHTVEKGTMTDCVSREELFTANGNKYEFYLDNYSISYTIPVVKPVQILNSAPENGRQDCEYDGVNTISVTFDETAKYIDETKIKIIRTTDATEYTVAVKEHDITDNTVTFTLQQPMSANSEYRFEYEEGAIKDKYGNNMTPKYSFKTSMPELFASLDTPEITNSVGDIITFPEAGSKIKVLAKAYNTSNSDSEFMLISVLYKVDEGIKSVVAIDAESVVAKKGETDKTLENLLCLPEDEIGNAYTLKSYIIDGFNIGKQILDKPYEVEYK